MKPERFEEIIQNLKLEKNKWLTLSDIDSIILNNGVGIYPDWRHLRFLITDKGEILIRHGTSVPYGAKLSLKFRLSMDYTELSFNSGSVISPTEYYADFRLPKMGDVFYVLNDDGSIQSQALVANTEVYPGLVTIRLSNPIRPKNDFSLCFYDPNLYDQNSCIHGTERPGVFMKFTENSGKTYKNLGVFHEILKPKDIKEINLSLRTKHNVYKLI